MSDHDPGDEDRVDRYEGVSTLMWTLAALVNTGGNTPGTLIAKMIDRDDEKHTIATLATQRAR